MTLVPVRDAARGKWRGVLSTLGIEGRFLSGKNGPCPVCGKGKDCFRFTDHNRDGMWLCSKCGEAGDGLNLLMQMRGWDFRTAAQEVEAILGVVRDEPAKVERSDAQKRADMTALWRASRPIEPIDPAALWLQLRVGMKVFPPCLRAALPSRWTDRRPAMLAKVVSSDGLPVQIHRTLLTDDGLKAPVDKPRMVMPGPIPKGCAVRLAEYDGELGIAEGIETALAATDLFGIPCWAALNAGNLEGWRPPETVKRVVVFGDCDASFTGQLAAFALARRLSVADIEVDVRIPQTIGHDWNDVFIARQSEDAA